MVFSAAFLAAMEPWRPVDVDEPSEDVHPRIVWGDLLHKLAGAMTIWIRWIPSSAIVSEVERKEHGLAQASLVVIAITSGSTAKWTSARLERVTFLGVPVGSVLGSWPLRCSGG